METHCIKKFESEDNIFCLCPWHTDSKPSLVIHKTGPFVGQYICFSCGKKGVASEIGFQIEAKPTKKKKVVDWNSKLFIAVKNDYWTDIKRKKLSQEWNVSEDVLLNLSYGWLDPAHIFPMRNENKQIIGLQRRFTNGRKICWDGSKLGLFIPSQFPQSASLFITEGPSDTAVALDLGFAAIGRPSCNTGARLITRWLSEHNYYGYDYGWVWSRIIIVSDNGNDHERKGAEKLNRLLLTKGWNCGIITPDARDLRAYRDKIGKEKTKQWLLESIK